MSIRTLLLTLLLLGIAAVGAAVWWVRLPIKKYTAKACLAVALIDRTTHPQVSAEVDWDEFKAFRGTQAMILRDRFVIQAALHDKRLTNMPCIVRENKNHNALAWLTDQIHVQVVGDDGCVIEVSATEPDPNDAAALVNAVVDAYMSEVVNADHQKRRERYDSLSSIASEMEGQVRLVREQLRNEPEGQASDSAQEVRANLESMLQIFRGAIEEKERLRIELQTPRRVTVMGDKNSPATVSEKSD